MIDTAFAVGVLAMLWASRRGRCDRLWGYALAVLWVVNEFGLFWLDRDTRLTVGLSTDFVLALVALLRFTFSRGRWWELALALTWITQIFAHWTFADDIPTMGLWLNVLCGAQIALVCSDRAADAISTWARPMRRSNSALSRASRSATRALGGPDCRSGALRAARKRMEGQA